MAPEQRTIPAAPPTARFAVTTYRCLDPLKYAGWDEEIARRPGATVFHSAGWARVLKECFGCRPVYVGAFRNEQLGSVLPLMEVSSRLTGRRGVSLPFADFCEPLVTDEQEMRGLYNEALRLAGTHGWRYVEFRGGCAARVRDSGGDAGPGADSMALDCTRFYEHTLDPSVRGEEPEAACDESVQRALRQARQAGARVDVDASLASLRTFYRLNSSARVRYGLPVQPLAFFEALHRELLSHDQGFVVTVRIGDRAIASGVFFRFAGRAIFKYMASDRRHHGLRSYDLIIREGIRVCAAAGDTLVSLGRTPAGNVFLRRHKAGWTASEKEHRYVRLDALTGASIRPDAACRAGMPRQLIRCVPASAARVASRLLYRHFG